jgi:hypothetical protein
MRWLVLLVIVVIFVVACYVLGAPDVCVSSSEMGC